MKHLYNITVVVLLCFTVSTQAQNFHVVKDINTLSPSYPQYLDSAYGILYFSADDGIHGRELWRSDGTAQGTYMVKDINEGPAGSNPKDMTGSGGVIYFSALTQSSGTELWVSDGTQNGTRLVKQITPGTGSSYLQNLTDVNGVLFFTQGGLWRSDGTAKGTVQLIINHDGKNYISPQDLVSYKDSLFLFALNPGFDGEALFKIGIHDTAATFIKNVYGPSLTSEINKQLLVVNGILYFQGSAGNTSGLWRSDGSSNGTYLVKNIFTKLFVNLNDTLFFCGSDINNGEDIWKSDGTEAGTVMIKNIDAGKAPNSISTTNVFKGKVYFLYNIFSETSSKSHVWKTDGTEEGTIPAFDFGSDYEKIEATGDYLFFRKEDLEYGAELWKSDGTQQGTSIVKDILPGQYSSFYSINIKAIGNTLFFAAGNAETGDELWKTDGTLAHTIPVKDINTATTTSAYPAVITTYNNKLFISAVNEKEWQPWITDGTDTGTYMLKEIKPDTLGIPRFYNTCIFRDKLYFQYYVHDYWVLEHMHQLWGTDGTTEGTELIAVTENMHKAARFTAADTIIYFLYHTAEYGSELWKTSGTKKSSVLVKDINPGPGDAVLEELYVYDNILYFSAAQDLWRSDGTEAGTYKLSNVVCINPKHFYSFNSKVYFVAFGLNREVWCTDGTSAGTLPVTDSITGRHLGSAEEMLASGGKLFFEANDGVYGRELWKTNGAGYTATLVKDITAGTTYTNIANLTDVNGTLFFTHAPGFYDNSRNALWKTDGTTEGTQIIKDNFFASGQFTLSALVNVSGKLAFLVAESVAYPVKNKLWQSDGTKQGTQEVKDDNLVDITYDYSILHALGDKVFLYGRNNRYGSELWCGTLPPLPVPAKKSVDNIAMSVKENLNITAAPNPFAAALVLSLYTDINCKARITVTDMYGTAVAIHTHTIVSGSNTIRYNTALWAAGVYFVQVKGSSGLLQTIKVIKQ